MRSTRILTAAALTASGLVLSAGAASAQTATPNPDLRSFPTGPSCAEQVVSGSVRTAVVASTLPKGARPTVTLQLRWNAGGTAYPDTSVVSSQSVFLQAGANDYTYSLSAAGVPSTAKNLLVYAIAYPNAGTAPSDTLQSKVLATSFCAAPASSTPTTIPSVSIDCSGDLVTGAAAIADPPASGSLPGTVTLQGRPAGATTWTSLGSKAHTVTATTTSMPYEFSIAGKHQGEYRALARVNNGSAVFSDVITDATCAPPAEVPEAPVALLLPLSMAAGAGAVVAVRRRRDTTPALSA